MMLENRGRKKTMKTATALVVLALGLATPAGAAEITVLSTGGARAVMTSLVPEHERISGDHVTISFATPGQMRDKLVGGEAADVAVGIAAIMPDLEKAGRIVAGSRAEFAASYVGVVVRAGAPKLDLATPEAIKRAVLAAKTIALSDPSAGTQLGATFIATAERHGFGAELKSRAKMIQGPGSDVSQAVAKGEADMGVTLISEILPVAGTSLAGELPADFMNPTVMYAFQVSGARNPETAKKLLTFLGSPEARKVIESKGMKPPKP
jgi:molybdate transport system substrate-binding protein